MTVTTFLICYAVVALVSWLLVSYIDAMAKGTNPVTVGVFGCMALGWPLVLLTMAVWGLLVAISKGMNHLVKKKPTHVTD